MSQTEKGGVLVFGGSGGLGSAIVRRLAVDWPFVDFTYRSNATRARELTSELETATSVAAHRLDLADENELKRVVDAAHRRSGGLRALVYSSGVSIQQPYVSAITSEQWDEVIQTELVGFIKVVQTVLPLFRDAGGSIVNIGSVGTRWFPPGDALSAVPKAGTEMLCRAVAKEEGRYGIRANTVAPGIIAAGIGGGLMGTIYTPEIWEQQKKRTPLRRFGMAEDIASAAAFLCSSGSSFITGQTLIVDGGLSL